MAIRMEVNPHEERWKHTIRRGKEGPISEPISQSGWQGYFSERIDGVTSGDPTRADIAAIEMTGTLIREGRDLGIPAENFEQWRLYCGNEAELNKLPKEKRERALEIYFGLADAVAMQVLFGGEDLIKGKNISEIEAYFGVKASAEGLKGVGQFVLDTIITSQPVKRTLEILNKRIKAGGGDLGDFEVTAKRLEDMYANLDPSKVDEKQLEMAMAYINAVVVGLKEREEKDDGRDLGTDFLDQMLETGIKRTENPIRTGPDGSLW